jgi:uncharacterized membrane protein YtjA (UPF0391 family)
MSCRAPDVLRRDVAARNRIQQVVNRRFGRPQRRPFDRRAQEDEYGLEPCRATKVGWRNFGVQAGGVTVTLLKWALIFFLVSVVAGILGFTGISAASADVARFLFYVFVVIFLVLLILGLTIFRV